MPNDYTPDMTVAGATPPPQDTAGLMDAMRTQGTPPAGLMEALRPPTMTYPSQLAYAAASGLNPTGINPIERQQNIQQEMAMQQVGLIQRAQEHAQRMAMEKNAAAMGVAKDMLFGGNAIEDPQTRNVIAKQHAGLVGQLTGQTVPESVVTQWSMGGPNQKSQKRLAEIISAADVAEDPAIKAQTLQQAQQYFMEHGGKPEDWQATQRLMLTPAYLKAAGLPSREESVISHAKMEEELNKSWLSKNPQFSSLKGQEKAPALAAQFALEVLKKPNLREVTDPTELAAMKAYVELGLAKERKREDEAALDRKKAEADITLERQKELAKYTAGLRGDKELSVPQKLALEKTLDKAGGRQMILENIDNILKDLPEMVKEGVIPASKGVGPATQAWINRKTSEKGNTLWTKFGLNWAPLVIGQIDRQLKDEKAARAIGAFGAALGVGENGAPAPALQAYLMEVRKQVIDAGNRDIQNAITVGLPQNVIDSMRGIYGVSGPLAGGNQKATLEKLSREKYLEAKRRGYSDDEIRAKGYEIPK